MRVLIVSSWGTPCGIAEHSKMLCEAVIACDPEIRMVVDGRALDPQAFFTDARELPDLVHLNHHDALHSRWTPDHVRAIRARGIPVVVTYHDTRSGAPGAENSTKLIELATVANATIVHEPVEDVPQAIYWRQGIPAPAHAPVRYTDRPSADLRAPGFKAFPQQPVLGTVGFNFPWKNFDRLARETKDLGWALVILSTNATREDGQRWMSINPHCHVEIGHLQTAEIVNFLAGCDATAFPYECQNNGTSGAVRLGIAARKPVLLFEGCRQFRDLRQYEETQPWVFGNRLRWCRDWPDFRRQLGYITPAIWDPGSLAFAQEDSWSIIGARYAGLYRSLTPGVA
jgi:hypothetical protein